MLLVCYIRAETSFGPARVDRKYCTLWGRPTNPESVLQSHVFVQRHHLANSDADTACVPLVVSEELVLRYAGDSLELCPQTVWRIRHLISDPKDTDDSSDWLRGVDRHMGDVGGQGTLAELDELFLFLRFKTWQVLPA